MAFALSFKDDVILAVLDRVFLAILRVKIGRVLGQALLLYPDLTRSGHY